MWHFLEEPTAILVYRHELKKQITLTFLWKVKIICEKFYLFLSEKKTN